MDTTKKLVGPTIQILPPLTEIKGGSGSSGASRYRLNVSDGVSSSSALATSKFAQLVMNQQVKGFSIIRVIDYQVNFVSSRTLPIINDAELVASVQYQIGQPVEITAPQDIPAAAPFGASAGAWAPPSSAAASGNPYTTAVTGAVVRTGGGVGVGAGISTPVTPITGLSPYVSRWTIMVRVTSKSDIRTWSNPKSSGELFKIDLIDDQNSAISATFFGKEAVAKFYKFIEVDKVYYMAGGRVKVGDPKFSKHQYEITFDDKSTISLSSDNTSIAKVQVDYKTIAQISSIDKDAVVDMIAVVSDCKDLVEINSKAGKPLKKRELVLKDNSGENQSAMSIELTLWESKAQADYPVGSILSIKGVKVGDWNVKSLSGWGSTQITFNPDHDISFALASWYNNQGGKDAASTSLSEKSGGRGGGGATLPAENDLTLRFTVASLKGEGGASENISMDGSSVFMVKASIKFIKNDVEKLAYPGCTATRDGRVCNKKLDKGQPGSYESSWNCSQCGPQSIVDWRYMLSAILFDHSGENFVTMFNAESEQLMGMKAEKLMSLGGYDFNSSTTSNEVHPDYQRKFSDLFFTQALFTVKVKADSGRDQESRITLSAVKMKPLTGATLVNECKALIVNIDKYMKG